MPPEKASRPIARPDAETVLAAAEAKARRSPNRPAALDDLISALDLNGELDRAAGPKDRLVPDVGPANAEGVAGAPLAPPATARAPAAAAGSAARSRIPTYLDACEDLLRSGHAAMARERVEAFISKHGASAAAYALLGQAHRALGDTAAAFTAFHQADVETPGYLPARLLHAETRAAEGDIDGARRLLYNTSDLHPASANVLIEIAALAQGRADYDALRRQWLTNRSLGMTSPTGARAVAKAACLVDAFDEAREIFRGLIQAELERLREDKAHDRVRPAKASTGRVGDGKGEQALHDLKALLQDARTPFFLISGTLLGYLRESRMLPGDKDIDIGVFQEDYDQKALEKAFRRSPVFVVKRLDNTSRLRVAHINGVWIDVFPHYREGDLIWHDGTCTRWSNTPFEIGTMTIDGEEYRIPSPPERYLDENYGDWRTPDAMFDVRYQAPNAEITSQDYLSVLIYTRMLESLVGAKWAVIGKYAADFPDMFGSDPVLADAAREAADAASRPVRPQPSPTKTREPPVVARRQPRSLSIAEKPGHIRVVGWFARRWKRVFG